LNLTKTEIEFRVRDNFLFSFINAILTLLLLVVLSSVLYANIINVPVDFETIQSAIDSSQSGDTILIAEGQYEEELLVDNQDLTLASRYLIDNDTSNISETIISGDSLFRILIISSNNDHNVNIIGITFVEGTTDQNNTASAIYANGINLLVDECRFINNYSAVIAGALTVINCEILISNSIFINNYSLTGSASRIINCRGIIQNNIIRNNIAANFVGGIYVLDSSVDVVNNEFSNNRSEYSTGGLRYHNSTGNIENNIFLNNYARSFAGGLHAVGTGFLLIENNIFRGNQSGGIGGGVIVHGDNVEIRENLFEENIAASYNEEYQRWQGNGGGIYVSGHQDGYIEIYENCFIGNVAAWYGGAIDSSDSLYFHHNIFLRNRSPLGSALYAVQGQLPYVEGHDNLFKDNQPAYEYSNDYHGAVTQGNQANFRLYDNDFIGNPIVAAKATHNGTIDGRNNFWGDSTGPQHEDDNPEGRGDIVDPSVQVIPFSTERHTPFAPPDFFDLETPADEDTTFLSTMNFTWNSTTDPNDDPVTYTLETAFNDTFYEAIRYPAGTDTFFQIDQLENDTTYRWRVFAEDHIWMRTYSSHTHRLTVILEDDHFPTAFSLGEPGNDAGIEEESILFTWFPSADSTAGDVISYTLELSNDEDFEQAERMSANNDTFFWAAEFDESLYYWRVFASDLHNHITYSSESRSFNYLDVEDTNLACIPGSWELTAIYPNPFNPVVRIVVGVPEKAHLKVEIFDLLGRSVAVLKDDELQPGYHKMVWLAKGSTGIYLLRTTSETGWKETRKLLFIK